LPRRATYLALLHRLPRATAATDLEVLQFVDRHRLFGIGIGYIDAHLLAALALTPKAVLWARDKRLNAAAGRLGLPTHLPYSS
jgi:hypothetical protein